MHGHELELNLLNKLVLQVEQDVFVAPVHV
jgi:hypothetical protein